MALGDLYVDGGYQKLVEALNKREEHQVAEGPVELTEVRVVHCRAQGLKGL